MQWRWRLELQRGKPLARCNCCGRPLQGKESCCWTEGTTDAVPASTEAGCRGSACCRGPRRRGPLQRGIDCRSRTTRSCCICGRALVAARTELARHGHVEATSKWGRFLREVPRLVEVQGGRRWRRLLLEGQFCCCCAKTGPTAASQERNVAAALDSNDRGSGALAARREQHSRQATPVGIERWRWKLRNLLLRCGLIQAAWGRRSTAWPGGARPCASIAAASESLARTSKPHPTAKNKDQAAT